jgi:hypothetical protein
MNTILFEMGEAPMIFRDAIVLPDDSTLTDSEIEAIKQARYDAWLLAIQPVDEEVEEV